MNGTNFVNLATGNMRAPANPVTADTPVRRPRVDSETPWKSFWEGLAHGPLSFGDDVVFQVESCKVTILNYRIST